METAETLAATRQWRSEVISTPVFDLASFGPARMAGGSPLIVYVEGDGAAWMSRTQLSNDPTPRRPVALELAVADPRPNVVYLARPCQYVTGRNRRNCQPAYWDTAGYSEDVVSSVDAAVSVLARRAGASKVVYVGYSGGGAVAALVAARRSDSAGLVTVAGVLDHATWTRLDGVDPLRYSLNPADEAARLAGLPQLHYSGGRDKTVPTAVARAYAARFAPNARPKLVVVPDYDHECCWAAGWRGLIAQPLPLPGEP
jgi:pimeloyl-ACP methyl ester carboxylesterase